MKIYVYENIIMTKIHKSKRMKHEELRNRGGGKEMRIPGHNIGWLRPSK